MSSVHHETKKIGFQNYFLIDRRKLGNRSCKGVTHHYNRKSIDFKDVFAIEIQIFMCSLFQFHRSQILYRLFLFPLTGVFSLNMSGFIFQNLGAEATKLILDMLFISVIYIVTSLPA